MRQPVISYTETLLKEITAPEGYKLSEEIRKVTVDKEDAPLDAGTFINGLIVVVSRNQKDPSNLQR